MYIHKWQLFVHLFTHKEGDTSDSNTIFMKNPFYKMLLQGISNHMLSIMVYSLN